MRQHVTIIISGKVQGVFFRRHTKEIADRLGIQGWVSNCDDGSVRIEAEGKEKALKIFLEWCTHGPSLAHVEHITTIASPLQEDFQGFTIWDKT